MALNINGRMKVKTLKTDFEKEFGLNIRLYDGREFADDDATLASIRKGDSIGGEFSPARNTKVGNLEDKILELFGLKTQVAGSDDSYLCENAHTLAKALEVDEKLMVKRANRETKTEDEDIKINEEISEEEQMSIEEISEEYDKFENEMNDRYHPDNVLLIRDRFREYLVKYAEGYKDAIDKAWQNDDDHDDYNDIWEWIDEGYLELFPTEYEVDVGTAKKALDDMKIIAQNFIDFMDNNNNNAPSEVSQILPDGSD